MATSQAATTATVTFTHAAIGEPNPNNTYWFTNGSGNIYPNPYQGSTTVPLPTIQTVGEPKIPVRLDATEMRKALEAYRDFLEGLDGLDQESAEVVDSTLFGLREAIEALERLE